MYQKMEEMIISSVLGFIVGDALGVPVEFKNREDLKKNPVQDMREYGTHNQPKGTWSDDTSMMIATMDSISQCKRIDFKDIMIKYMEWYQLADYTPEGNVFDIGIGTRKALERFKSGVKAEKCGGSNYNNNGNGSLMRMLPIALYYSFVEVPYNEEVEKTYYYSSLTHAHEISIAGCKVYSDYIKELLKTGNPKEALLNLKNYNYDRYYDEINMYSRIISGEIENLSEEKINSSGFVVDSLEASIWCLINSSNYETAVLKAVNLGGDTDTIGAITGALAGITYGYQSIPKEWLSSIINIDYIMDIIKNYSATIKEISKKKESIEEIESSEKKLEDLFEVVQQFAGIDNSINKKL